MSKSQVSPWQRGRFSALLLVFIALGHPASAQEPGTVRTGPDRETRPPSKDSAAPQPAEPSSLAAADSTHTDADAAPLGLRFYWKDTLRADSPDKNLRLKFGGRFHGDWAVFGTHHEIEEELADFQEGTEVRRARLYYSGTLYKHFEFKTQVELSERKIEARTVTVGLLGVPVIGNIRAGHFKEPFGLESLTSSKYITFLERGLAAETFAPGRNAGVMLHDTAMNERMTWAVGVFRDTDRFFDGEFERGLGVTGRLTALPWYQDGGARLLHVGVAYSHRDLGTAAARFRARPESHLAPRLVDTGNLQANALDLLGVEAAVVLGPFSVQSEYVHAFVNRHYAYDVEFNGVTVQASYFLTGEHRVYDKDSAAFGRTRPKRNFGKDGGLGAWEVAARYSYLDLNDAEIRGGRLNDVTLGLNWYLNPNMRISWNYVYADPQDSGSAHIFQTRLQLAF